MNVVLRPLTPRDAPWIDAWLPSVAANVGYDAGTTAMLEARPATASVIVRDRVDVGLAVWSVVGRDARYAIIELIATAPEHARKGSGMRAAAMLEDVLRREGFQTLYAPAPERNGISMYFWIRLGYRPVFRDAWPCERSGIAWLRRDIGDQTNGSTLRTASRKSAP